VQRNAVFRSARYDAVAELLATARRNDDGFGVSGVDRLLDDIRAERIRRLRFRGSVRLLGGRLRAGRRGSLRLALLDAIAERLRIRPLLARGAREERARDDHR